MNVTPLQLLRAARAHIERGWTQGVMAQDHTGYPVDPASVAATCWCASGALHRAAGSGETSDVAFLTAWKVLETEIADEDGLVAWNDDVDRTKDEVLAAFDRAIARMETPAAGDAVTTEEATNG